MCGEVAVTSRSDTTFELRARRLLLACGVRDELPSIEGLAERWGNTVLHCADCHGYEMADQPLAIYARGKSALTTVAMLWQLSRNLLLCSGGPATLRNGSCGLWHVEAFASSRHRSSGWRRPR